MTMPSHDKTNNGYPLPQNPAPGGYSGGAAYPYAVPPPPSSYSIFYQEPTPTAAYEPFVMPSFLCRFLALIAGTVTVIFVVLLIGMLILQPRLPEFRVDSASLSSLNDTVFGLTAGWDITLVVSNPNRKLGIYYDAVSAGVFYRKEYGDLLAYTRLPPFYQHTQSKTTLRFQFSVVDEFVVNGVANRIAADRAGGLVQFGVVLSASVRFNLKIGIFHSRDRRLNVYCDPLSFVLSPNRTTGVLLRGLICE